MKELSVFPGFNMALDKAADQGAGKVKITTSKKAPIGINQLPTETKSE